MVAEYKSKREKFQATKRQATDERRPVREMERIMDVELFLGIQNQWAEDSPHCIVILHKMFQHAATKGQKEAEQIVCQGHQQNLPQVNPEAGIPTIQLVGPETSKEELLELYLEVYNLHRLPGSPLGSQQYFKRCCPPSQTTKGVKKKRHQQPWQGPILKSHIPLKVVYPTKERKTTWWKKSSHGM